MKSSFRMAIETVQRITHLNLKRSWISLLKKKTWKSDKLPKPIEAIEINDDGNECGG
jgi:hypothetical protein